MNGGAVENSKDSIEQESQFIPFIADKPCCCIDRRVILVALKGGETHGEHTGTTGQKKLVDINNADDGSKRQL